MSTPVEVLCAAIGGAVAGALGGLFAAVLTLLARRLRNRVLVAHDVPVPRDTRFPTMFVKLCGVVGLVIAGGLDIPLGLYLAVSCAFVPPVFLTILGISYAVSDARAARKPKRKQAKPV